MTHVFKLVASLAVSLIANASAAMAADVNHGEQLARRWCAGCHAVAPDQQQITEALSFTSVAARPDFDATKLAFFLLEPHPKMPNMSLTRDEAFDLAAYIKSLAK